MEVGDNENSNKKTDIANVKRDLVAGEYFKVRKRKVMPKELLKLHEDRAIYIHDFDQWEQLTNCNITNLEDMLMNGTFITNAYINQPNSIQTAFNIASQIALSVANQEYGGISYANINEIMSFFAKKNFRKNFIDTFRLINNVSNSSLDDVINNIEKRFGKIDSGNNKLKLEYERCFNEALNKTDKDIYDACQIFEYQVNSLSAQSQTPFITITFNIPTNWESERVVVNYLKVRDRGLGKEYGKNTTIFPKLSYFVVDGYNLKEGDKYYWLTKEVAKCMSRNVYPDILNISKIDYDKGRYFARMGCRSRVNHDYIENGKYAQQGRFNWGVQTLSLPHLYFECIRDNKGWNEFDIDTKLELFLNKIRQYTNSMEKAMRFRFDNVRKLKPKNVPILFMAGALARLKDEDDITPLLLSNKSSVSYGYIGIGDVIDLLTNRQNTINDEIGQKIGLDIIKVMSEEIEKLKTKTGFPVSLYGTPAESSIYTYYIRDLELFGDIMPEWLKSRGYYTNSFHYPSERKITSFEKIKAEAPFHKYSNGGNISYVENIGKKENYRVILELIQYAYEQGIEYFGVNTVTNKCFECGYEGDIPYSEEHNTYICPQCNNKNPKTLDITLRCCGYLSKYNITKAVLGRIKEMNNRVKHN